MKVKCGKIDTSEIPETFFARSLDDALKVIEGLLENDEPISKEEFTNHCLSDYALILGCEYTYDDYLEEFEEHKVEE